MNKDIIFITVPKLDPSTPIAAPAVLKAQVEANGFKALVMDMNIYLYNHMENAEDLWWGDEHPCWLNTDMLKKEYGAQLQRHLFNFASNVLEYDAKWIGITQFSTTSYAISVLLIEMLNLLGYDGKYVLGGPACMQFDSNTPILKLVDHVIYGDGEEALIQLLNGVTKYPGINTKMFRQITDLDKYPFPDYTDLNLNSYQGNGSILYMVASRGCVRNCSFCDIHAMAPKFKYRSGKCLADEVVYQSQTHPSVTTIRFADSLFNGAMKEFHTFLDTIIEYKEQGILRADMQFAGQAIVRPIRQCPPWYFEKMAKAGILSQDLGIESGSERVRDHMDKKFNNADLKHYIEMSYKYDIGITALMMVGYPTEEEEDFQATMDFFTEHQKHKDIFHHIVIGGTFIFMPYAPIWHRQEELGVKMDNRENWIVGHNTFDARMDRRARLLNHVTTLGFKIPVDNHQKVINKYNNESESLPSFNDFWGYNGSALEVEPQYKG